MAIAEIATTASSEKLDNASFQYAVVPSRNKTFEELTVVISFTFIDINRDTYHGSTERILDNPQKAEAESFLHASQKAWNWKYVETDEIYQLFVKNKLNEKWEELNGKKLTGKILIFN